MKNALLLLTFLLWLPCSVTYAGERFNDTVIGTLEIQNDKPILLRCDLAKTPYLMADKNGNSEVYV